MGAGLAPHPPLEASPRGGHPRSPALTRADLLGRNGNCSLQQSAERMLLMLRLRQTLPKKENLPLQNKQKPSPKQHDGSWAPHRPLPPPRCGAEPQGCPQLPQHQSDRQALAGSAWASASPKPKRCPCCSPLRKAHRQGTGTRGHTDTPHTRCSPGPGSDSRPVPCGKLGQRLKPALSSRPLVV